MRALLTLLCACVIGGFAARTAAAKDLPPEVRAMAERAFLEGRYDDLDTILVAAKSDRDRFPLTLLRTWWRVPDAVQPAASPPIEAAGGGDGPYPLILALAADRERRESKGAHGLPAGSPLTAYRARLDPERDAEAIWFLDDVARLMQETYGDPVPTSIRERRHFESQVNTAKTIALGALGAFVVLSFFGALGVARYRPAAGEGSGEAGGSGATGDRSDAGR